MPDIAPYIENRVDQGVRNPRVDSTGLLPIPTDMPAASAASINSVPAPAVKSTGFDDNGSVQTGLNSTPSGSVAINKDTTALKHKGVLHEDGESGDHDLKNSTQSFKNAVGTAAGLLGAAMLIKGLTANSKPRDPVSNYYLTVAEKTLLQQKAGQFASIGIVPYDALEDFLYILVTVDNYEDLSYISHITGIDDLDDRRLVRNPYGILQLNDLYKVGYLANGVSSITRQFSSSYGSTMHAADAGSSINGALLGVASFSSSPLGALANVYGAQAAVSALGLKGTAATVAAAALVSAGSISQFPGINIISDLVSGISQDLGATAAITALLGTPSGFGGTSGQIAQLGGVSSRLSSISSQTLNASSVISSQGIASTGPIAAAMMTLSKQMRSVSNHTNQLSSVTTIAGTASKAGDVNNQLSKVNSMTAGLVTGMASITSMLGGITGPGNISSQAGMLQRVGGFATSGVISQLVLGQSVPPSVICRNPMMQPPSYAGRAFFGEGMTPRMSSDQMFCRRIATFPSNPAGSGLMSFQMQNFGSFGGGLSITNMLSLVTLGTPVAPTVGSLGLQIASLASNISSIMGGSTSSIVDVRRSDNAIPFMIAASAALTGDTKSPFSTSVFSTGWKVASSVGNDLQRHSPHFLETARTSL